MTKYCTCCDGYKHAKRREEIRHGGVTEEELPHRKTKKDTKRWCKGKVGREHEFVRLYQQYYSVDACKHCGRYGRYYFRGTAYWL